MTESAKGRREDPVVPTVTEEGDAHVPAIRARLEKMADAVEATGDVCCFDGMHSASDCRDACVNAIREASALLSAKDAQIAELRRSRVNNYPQLRRLISKLESQLARVEQERIESAVKQADAINAKVRQQVHAEMRELEDRAESAESQLTEAREQLARVEQLRFIESNATDALFRVAGIAGMNFIDAEARLSSLVAADALAAQMRTAHEMIVNKLGLAVDAYGMDISARIIALRQAETDLIALRASLTAQAETCPCPLPWYVEDVRPGREDEARVYDARHYGVFKPTCNNPAAKRPLAEWICALANSRRGDEPHDLPVPVEPSDIKTNDSRTSSATTTGPEPQA